MVKVNITYIMRLLIFSRSPDISWMALCATAEIPGMTINETLPIQICNWQRIVYNPL